MLGVFHNWELKQKKHFSSTVRFRSEKPAKVVSNAMAKQPQLIIFVHQQWFICVRKDLIVIRLAKQPADPDHHIAECFKHNPQSCVLNTTLVSFFRVCKEACIQ